tara:strand:- start:388 stop:1191 length:804 start_codon:yes stop_codon:yes gene_type:complete
MWIQPQPLRATPTSQPATKPIYNQFDQWHHVRPPTNRPPTDASPANRPPTNASPTNRPPTSASAYSGLLEMATDHLASLATTTTKKRANRDAITIMPDASKYFVVNTQGAIITRPKTGQSTWQSEHTNAEIEQTLLDFGTNQNFHQETRLSATERINIIGSSTAISVYAFRTRRREQVNPYSIVSSSMEYTNGAMVLHYTSPSSKPGRCKMYVKGPFLFHWLPVKATVPRSLTKDATRNQSPNGIYELPLTQEDDDDVLLPQIFSAD